MTGLPTEKSGSYEAAGSSYGNNYEAGPCVAAPAPTPIAFYLSPAPAGLHYRANDDVSTDVSEHPQARAYGGYEGVSGSASGPSGSAVGLFPRAAGCGAVPVLLSCAPRVVSGHLVKSHSGGYTAPSYREDTNTQMGKAIQWSEKQAVVPAASHDLPVLAHHS